MSTVIVYAGTEGAITGSGIDIAPGMYLKEYHPEHGGGRGLARWTSDKSQALVFGSFAEAFNAWRSVPESRPLRPDGEPNRPLTAFTVSFEEGPQ